jgi:hypothetical protein
METPSSIVTYHLAFSAKNKIKVYVISSPCPVESVHHLLRLALGLSFFHVVFILFPLVPESRISLVLSHL